jgi:hypothetical protein
MGSAAIVSGRRMHSDGSHGAAEVRLTLDSMVGIKGHIPGGQADAPGG